MSAPQRILVIDDQQEILDLTAMVLTDAGYDAVTARSGREALDRLADGSFDLVLLDINMPEMDGWETLRLVRADEELTDLPIVMFSVKGELIDKVHSLQEGASGYITKPFVVDELVARVRRILGSEEAASVKPPSEVSVRHDRYRTGYLKLRSVLFDRTTALPAFPVLFDELRTLLDDRRELGLLHIEIVNLELVESLYGWQVFDRIVARAADVLRASVGREIPESALLALNGVAGERFVVFLPERPDGELADAEFLEQAGRELRRRLELAFDADDFRGLGPEICFRVGQAHFSDDPFFRFERCIYAAVEQARGAHDRRERRRELSWGEELEKIIQTGAIGTVFQPIVELDTRDLLGYEAFVRGPADTMFETPRTMFALSNRIGLDATLDRVCCERAIEEFARSVGGGKLFLNLLPGSLHDEQWCDGKLPELLERNDLQPSDLVLEVSERRAEREPEALRLRLQRFKEAGFGLALDDIGTGRLELAAIEEVAPGYLKLDSSMVRDIHENLIQQEVLLTLCRLAERIGAVVIAEGVESDLEADALRQGGARYAQGFLFAGPSARRWKRVGRRRRPVPGKAESK